MTVALTHSVILSVAKNLGERLGFFVAEFILSEANVFLRMTGGLEDCFVESILSQSEVLAMTKGKTTKYK